MSYLDAPFAITLICLAVGAFVGFFALVGVCLLVERWRR